jgi:hypothetical protein
VLSSTTVTAPVKRVVASAPRHGPPPRSSRPAAQHRRRRQPELARTGPLRVRRQPARRQLDRQVPRPLPVLLRHLARCRRLRRPGRASPDEQTYRAKLLYNRSGAASGRTAGSTCSRRHTRMSLLTAADVRALASRLDLRPTKTLGQNFVIDPNTVRRLVRTAGVGPDDVVVEVGPARLVDPRAARGGRPGRRGSRSTPGSRPRCRGPSRRGCPTGPTGCRSSCRTPSSCRPCPAPRRRPSGEPALQRRVPVQLRPARAPAVAAEPAW